MKTLVFGGSFDPPHYGHLNLLENAVRAVRPGRVLVVPAGAPPHKAANMAPGALRLAMCACFIPAFPALELCEDELRRPGPSYTADTLAELRRRRPGDDYYLSVGGDMLAHFTEWRRWHDLLNMATLVAACRTDAERPALERAAEALRAEGGRVLLAGGPVRPASSTAIRRAIAAGGAVAEAEGYALIPPPADAIARENRLYTSAAPEGAYDD